MSDFSNSFGDTTEPIRSSSAPERFASGGVAEQLARPLGARGESSSPDLAEQLEAASQTTPTQTTASIELSDMECRVLGSLIEKEFLTPDIYPMTTNALTTACNQKTNRDPVVSYAAVDIDNTLLNLRQRNLVRRVHVQGSRSTKHRQTLDEAISLQPGELAVMSVLMLRGPQTVGELRQRTERQHGFADLDATETCLHGLANRSLIEQLERQPGHKEARWQHLISDASEPQGSPVEQAPVSSDDRRVHESTEQQSSSEQSATESRPTNGLDQRVALLEAEVVKLRSQLEALADMLGESIE